MKSQKYNCGVLRRLQEESDSKMGLEEWAEFVLQVHVI